MVAIERRKLKEAILKNLSSTETKRSEFSAPRRAHKINLIGRTYQSGELEIAFGVSFTPEIRADAARAFDELRHDGYIVPTYDDLVDPENWVVITETGIDYLKRGLPDRTDMTEQGPAVPKLTLDTNGVINLFDPTAETPTSVDELAEIIKYGLSGRANVAITTRVEADLLGDRNAERKEQMLRTLGLLPVVGTLLRFDTSKWDGGDVWAGEESLKIAGEIQGILFPGLGPDDRRYKNKLMDVDHLVGHFINKRDVFVTDDRGILRRRDALQASPGIIVKTPAECVAYLEAMDRRAKPVPLDSASVAAGYHSAGFKGRVMFDYSNNDGSYAIGSGLALFETKWTKASDTSIYAYSDAESIDSLALAKGVAEIVEIGDVTRFDYSSRVRSPREGQIVVWKNTNGLYAATKVVSVKDDTRGDDRDELVFDYVILPDGSKTFVK